MLLHGGSCVDKEGVYAVEVLRLVVDRFTALPVVCILKKNKETQLVSS